MQRDTLEPDRKWFEFKLSWRRAVAICKRLERGKVVKHPCEDLTPTRRLSLAHDRTKSGDTRYLLVNANTRRDVDGKITGVGGAAQDVTDAKAAESMLAATAAELLQLVETANAPIFGTDSSGNVNEWNAMAGKITRDP